MKATFINYFAGRGGGNRVLFEVVKGLVNRGHDIEYHALQTQDWFDLPIPVTVHENPQKLQEAIPESDILIATWCMTAPIVDSFKGRKGIPAYYCQHYEPIFFFKPEDKRITASTYDLPLNIIANSPWLADTLKTLHKRDSILIVPGVDQTIFKPTRERVFEYDPEKPFKVLAFASATPFKGYYDVILPAIHYLWRRCGNVELHTFGDDLPMPYKFKKTHHPNLSDMQLADLYNECDLYVSGSWAESSPLPHLEAMSCGCPVACTVYGTEHYGDYLLRVPPKRPVTLGEALIALAKAPEDRQEISKHLLHDIKPFTWESTVDGAEAFFKELCGEA